MLMCSISCREYSIQLSVFPQLFLRILLHVKQVTWKTKFSMNKVSYPFKISAVLDIKSLCACISVCPALTATRMDG